MRIFCSAPAEWLYCSDVVTVVKDCRHIYCRAPYLVAKQQTLCFGNSKTHRSRPGLGYLSPHLPL